MILLVEGLLFSTAGVLLMLLFEIGSYGDVRRIRSSKSGKELYNAGILSTIFNHLSYGPITYYLATTICIDDDQRRSLCQQIYSIVAFLFIQSSLFTVCHYLMHTRYLYRFHRFHHKYNTIVLPSSGSAVSSIEFLLAYMLPIVLATKLASCDKISAVIAVTIVIILNLTLHTPALEKPFARYMPWIFVSTSDHLTHHSLLTCHYSAPIFNFDLAYETFRRVTSSK